MRFKITECFLVVGTYFVKKGTDSTVERFFGVAVFNKTLL